MTWSAKDQKYLWHPFSPLQPNSPHLIVTRGEGCYLILEDGRRILDGISSWWVNLHGHGNKKIAEAIKDQALKLEQVIFAGFTHEPAISLAEKVLFLLPDNQAKVFYSDDGSTSVEVALKIAIQYWENQRINKSRIIALESAYHGDTFGAMAVGARGIFTKPFQSRLFDVDFISTPGLNEGDKVISEFKRAISGNDTAAFIFEPLVQGAGGMLMHEPEILNEMIAMAQKQDILCIADEVMTGFGRTGKMFASDYLTSKPDFFCLSKGLTGGTLPLGITTCSDKVASQFRENSVEKTFYHGHSFTANPISCAAALASLEILTSKDCLTSIEQISRLHADFIKKNAFDFLCNLRHRGTILAMDAKTSDVPSYQNPIRKKIYDFFIERNILLRPLGNTIYILPPYIITEIELAGIYAAIREFENTLKQ